MDSFVGSLTFGNSSFLVRPNYLADNYLKLNVGKLI